MELKTSATIRNDRDMLKYERKLLKFWVQSFLLGVPKIIVGFRTPDGILERLEHLETQTIPTRVKKSGKNSWDGNVCINFAAAFLKCESTVLSIWPCEALIKRRAQDCHRRRWGVADLSDGPLTTDRGGQGRRAWSWQYFVGRILSLAMQRYQHC